MGNKVFQFDSIENLSHFADNQRNESEISLYTSKQFRVCSNVKNEI